MHDVVLNIQECHRSVHVSDHSSKACKMPRQPSVLVFDVLVFCCFASVCAQGIRFWGPLSFPHGAPDKKHGLK